jgi:hypothetical protein
MDVSKRYGHIGRTAQRQAVNALHQAGFQGDGAQNWTHLHGVNPSVETVWNWHTCSLMIFPSQTSSSLSG